jgi:hypothetical protein
MLMTLPSAHIHVQMSICQDGQGRSNRGSYIIQASYQCQHLIVQVTDDATLLVEEQQQQIHLNTPTTPHHTAGTVNALQLILPPGSFEKL